MLKTLFIWFILDKLVILFALIASVGTKLRIIKCQPHERIAVFIYKELRGLYSPKSPLIFLMLHEYTIISPSDKAIVFNSNQIDYKGFILNASFRRQKQAGDEVTVIGFDGDSSAALIEVE